MSVFTTDFIVKEEHIDALNHVNNVVYLQWVQEVANLHWTQLKQNHDTSQYVWVVVRHEIDYIKQALLGETVTAKTWVGETAGIKSIRHVDFYCGEKLLASAQTTFCLLNSKSFKPMRITNEVLSILAVK